MGGKKRIVKKELIKKKIEEDKIVEGEIEIFDDRRLILGEEDIDEIIIDKKIMEGIEGIRKKDEGRIIDMIMMEKMREKKRKKKREIERIGEIVVGKRLEEENSVRLGVVEGKNDDWRIEEEIEKKIKRLEKVNIRKEEINDEKVKYEIEGGMDEF